VDGHGWVRVSFKSWQDHPELAPIPNGVNCRHKSVSGEDIQQRPMSGANYHLPPGQILLARVSHGRRQPPIAALQIQHEGGSWARRVEKVSKQEARTSGRAKLPAIPEERERTESLQVPYL